ncbi:MAG: hypothetical protein JW748_05630 [Anaerolineales bacterium]|nr:hypothetical protein [Anaerolineales bacterium]
MNRYRIVCGLLILIPLMTGCSPEVTPQTIGTYLPTETQNIVTLTPTNTNTPTLSPTISNTPTPIQPDLEITNWAFVPPTFYFRRTYFVAIIKNNSDYGIVAPNGGVVTLECAGGKFSEIFLADVPPLAPHGEAVFLQTASETLVCSPITKVTIKYEVNGMVLTDNNHEVPNWKTEVMKESWESPAYRLTNSYITVENTSLYPCVVEKIITLAFDYNNTIIGMGIRELSDREGESLPIPPQKKMGFYIYVDTGVYNHAQEIKAFPIAKGYSFCENPDHASSEDERYGFFFPEPLKVIQSGGWQNPSIGNEDRGYYAFTVENGNSEKWIQSIYWHADIYDKDGRLIGIEHDHETIAIPPLGIGAGWGSYKAIEEAGWKKGYRVDIFAYNRGNLRNMNIELPVVENVEWLIKKDIPNVSCTLYNPEEFTFQDIYGAIGLLYDQEGMIIGAGGWYIAGELKVYTNDYSFSLEPRERVDLLIAMTTSERPDRIEVYPRISLDRVV